MLTKSRAHQEPGGSADPPAPARSLERVRTALSGAHAHHGLDG